jgi:hypothetical protein
MPQRGDAGGLAESSWKLAESSTWGRAMRGEKDDRSSYDKAEFTLMLNAISALYLTTRVLILLDGSYASRFWTLTEAWCSMQTVTPEGLRPATDTESRCTIACIHNAKYETFGEGLLDLVSEKTPDAMHNILKKPDVSVTNARDKTAMLPHIKHINDHVKATFLKHPAPDMPIEPATFAVAISNGAEDKAKSSPAAPSQDLESLEA